MNLNTFRKEVLQVLEDYILNYGYIESGYISMHNGLIFGRTHKIIRITRSLLSTNPYEPFLFLIDDKTFSIDSKTNSEYYFVKDKDTYFACSTVNEYWNFEYQDFEIFRKFYTKVTSHEFI